MKSRPNPKASPESTLRSLSASDLDAALLKDQMIVFRVSKTDKSEMQRVAKAFRLTLTEYLMRLHQLVVRKKG
jgi:hypothetical protein